MKKLDLHGFKVHDAWKEFNQYVESSYHKGFKFIIVITGHGEIAKEISGWVNAHPLAVSIRQDGKNTGSYSIMLKKNKHQPQKPKTNQLATKEDIAKLIAKWNG